MSTGSRKRRVAMCAVVILLTAGFLYRDHAMSKSQTEPETDVFAASGIIQAQQVSIASEFGGLVAEVAVSEGERVAVGDAVVRLDDSLLNGQIAVAEAMVAAAEAGLAQAKVGARPAQIAVAEAQLSQTQAALMAARQAVTDTLALIDTPQDLDLQIAVLRNRIDAAREEQAQAVALKDAVEVTKEAVDEAYDRFDGGGRHRFDVAEGPVEDLLTGNLPEELSGQLPADLVGNLPGAGEHTIEFGDYELHLDDENYQLYAWKNISFPMEATLLPNQWWQAWVGVNAATAQIEGLEAQLNQLYVQRADPQAMHSQLSEVMALEAQLVAQVRMAETQLDALQAGLMPEEIAVIQAKVDQAYAGVKALEAQRDLLVLTAPISGTVVDILLHEAEVAAQGATLVSVADLADLTVTVYVPETRLGEIWLDQVVQVQVDSFPGRTFEGYVSYISDSAEFTPRNVATVEERQNLVFAVDIRIANESGDLKPGMPADVSFTADTRAQ